MLRLIAVSDVWIELGPGMEGWDTKRQELLLQLNDNVLFLPLFSLTNGSWGVLQEELVSLGEFGTYRQDHMLYSIGFGFLKIFAQGSSIGCFSFSVVKLQMNLKFVTLRYNPGRLMLQTICSLLTDFPCTLGDPNIGVLFCLPRHCLAFQMNF